MMFKSFFPNDMKLARKFYDNEDLLGGYGKKLDGMKGEFICCICKDEKMNNKPKILKLKHEIRSLRNIIDDFNLIHGSQTTPEFVRQMQIIEQLDWQKASFDF